MLFAVICTDKEGGLPLRMETRPAHVDYLKSTDVVYAGPFIGADAAPKGSLVVVEAPDRTAAEDWAANDPYARAGLFSDVRIEAWTRVIG
jgi:uncharacterized protein YciI